MSETIDDDDSGAGTPPRDAQALLETANTASERVASLHVAFMAVCAYVLIIVFSTTDLDLLRGKGIHLPIMGVDVPIVGFYAFAPYVVVLVHFNLLLQLQLLSRKLFAFDAAAPSREGIGGLRDRLHIFPYTYYLVGRPSALMHHLVGLVVSITLLFLPLFTLLALHVGFLPYQNADVTWLQRFGTWLDVATLLLLWPIILHPKDDWRGYWKELIAAQVPRRRAWVSLVLTLVGLICLLFAARIAVAIAGVIVLLMSTLSVGLFLGWKTTFRNSKRYWILIAAYLLSITGLSLVAALRAEDVPSFEIVLVALLASFTLFWHSKGPRGSFALMCTLVLGSLLPLALQVDGELLETIDAYVQGVTTEKLTPPRMVDYFAGTATLEDTFKFKLGLPTNPRTLLSELLDTSNARALFLDGQVLFATPPKPETLALIRSGRWREALNQVEPMNLSSRSLRHAQLYRAILFGADLSGVDAVGASFFEAQLQRANLENADLQSASFGDTQLQGANLKGTHLTRTDLSGAQLQDADFYGAHLNETEFHEVHLENTDLRTVDFEGAYFADSHLQGANLIRADLRGATFLNCELQAADLVEADLEGVEFRNVQLSGARLTNAGIKGAVLEHVDLLGADLRGATVYFVSMDSGSSRAQLVDAIGVLVTPSSRLLRINEPTALISAIIADRMKEAQRRGWIRLQSCLAPPEMPLFCQTRYDPRLPLSLAEYTRQLDAEMAKLACESPEIARGLLEETKWVDSSRKGLPVLLKGFLDDPRCAGVQGLRPEEKNRLRSIQ